jgi:hypothetical protein
MSTQTNNPIPELEPHCGSWIVSAPNAGAVVELFERRNVERAAAAGWRIETAAQYLARIQREVSANVRAVERIARAGGKPAIPAGTRGIIVDVDTRQHYRLQLVHFANGQYAWCVPNQITLETVAT